jgi:hypothetical protein
VAWIGIIIPAGDIACSGLSSCNGKRFWLDGSAFNSTFSSANVSVQITLGDKCGYAANYHVIIVHYKPLYVIAFGQRESDYINPMITISNFLLGTLVNLGQSDHINQMITLSVMALSGFLCITIVKRS